MSTQPIARVNAGLPAGRQFAPTGHSEADANLEPDQDDSDICECGESLDDGEGYDGLCGNCADRAYAAELREEGDPDGAYLDDSDVDEADEPVEEPERLHENMGDGPIITAPSGKYGFYTPDPPIRR